MQTSKETFKEILISAGIRGSKRSSSTKESQSTKQKAKILHPPIETFWQLPPTKEHKRSTGSRTLNTIMSLPFKKGVQKSKSLRTILEGSHEPKDEQIVDSFRQLLFLEGQLPGKHSDYHTLLRFLRMRDYDLTKAKNMYLNYLKWRDEFHVEALSEVSSIYANNLKARVRLRTIEPYGPPLLHQTPCIAGAWCTKLPFHIVSRLISRFAGKVTEYSDSTCSNTNTEELMELKFEEFNEVKKCYPHGFHGVDKYGRPIYIERIGMVNVNRLLEVTTIERFVKYHVTEQEKTLNWRYPACSLAAKKHIASTVSILDVKDVGISNFSKPARYLFLEIQKIDSHYYPETLHRLFIINAGSGFKVLWKAIKTFLDQRTLAKIQVLGSNYTKTLLEVIDPSNLPTFFGGDCTCSDYGGCLFSDKGPWTDPAVTTILQAMVEAEEENGDDEKNSAAKDAFGGVTQHNVHIKDVFDATPSRNDTFEISRLTNQPFLQKILTLQSVVNDTKTKIQALEAALKDTKSVIEGLGRPIEDLKNQITVSNIRG